MKIKSLFAILLALTLLLSGCSAPSSPATSAAPEVTAAPAGPDHAANESQPGPKETPVPETPSQPSVVQASPSDIFSNRDFDTGYDESTSALIQLNGDTAACDSNAVHISGGTVTITDEGTYILSGTLNDGMIIIDSGKKDKTQLVLNNVDIHSETCAPIYILQSDKVFITMAEDSTNTLSNGGVFTAIDENNIDAVIFSKDDVTLNGLGTLIITSPAGHGIVSKDSLTVTSGTYDIHCASHGLNGKDDISVADGSFTIVSGKDGVHAENADDEGSGFVYIQSGSFDIAAEGDGISAGSYMQIEDGSFAITSGGGSVNAAAKAPDAWGQFRGGGRRPGDKMGGYAPMAYSPEEDASTDSSSSLKGMKAAGALTVNGGTFTIDSADDSIHSNASITVNGGFFEIASGDDAFHAEDTLTITAGTIRISGSYEGLEGLHIDISSGDITLTAQDDGLNAAGGNDSSGMTGGRDGMFGGRGGMPGFGASNGSITISGGTIHVTASGDGIDANGTLEITGGDITVCGPVQGDTATLDYDVSAVISGGTFMGTGAAGMAQTFSGSEQGVIAIGVGNQPAGTEITIADSDGSVLVSYAPDLPFAVVIYSSRDIVRGKAYTVTIGSASDEVIAN